MLSDLAMAAPLPYIAAPYLSCCGFHLAGSPGSENFRLCVPEKQQQLFTVADVGRNQSPALGTCLRGKPLLTVSVHGRMLRGRHRLPVTPCH